MLKQHCSLYLLIKICIALVEVSQDHILDLVKLFQVRYNFVKKNTFDFCTCPMQQS
jgi:hypothetical protein